jgi:hypothetical protein
MSSEMSLRLFSRAPRISMCWLFIILDSLPEKTYSASTVSL